MARAAFVMDRIMHKMGLHGKTFLPLLLGYGCNVPAIMATRTLENRKDRLIAILINPLIPCGARLGVMSFIVSIFFTGAVATLVMLSLIMISLGLVFLMGVIFRRFVLPGEHPPFLMELPPYQMPGLKDIAMHTWERAWIFVKKAGTVIVAVSIVIWLLSNYPGPGMENSYAAMLGRALEPIGSLMGFDWRIMVALIAGFGAKETTITTLGVLYASGGSGSQGFIATITAALTPLTAYTFLLVQMIYVPCLATVAMIKKETGSWKWTAVAVGYTLLLAFILGTAVYGLGRLMGWGV
jgi:ferrous iron transport protein B